MNKKYTNTKIIRYIEVLCGSNPTCSTKYNKIEISKAKKLYKSLKIFQEKYNKCKDDWNCRRKIFREVENFLYKNYIDFYDPWKADQYIFQFETKKGTDFFVFTSVIFGEVYKIIIGGSNEKNLQRNLCRYK